VSTCLDDLSRVRGAGTAERAAHQNAHQCLWTLRTLVNVYEHNGAFLVALVVPGGRGGTQEPALSRWRHGFESRWGCERNT
jgi:hypothetical protein